jgi:transglutaminase-like putative cysteine protease
MRFFVTHGSLYRYDGPVNLAPHVLRLTPRPAGVYTRSLTLAVRPTPVETSELLDAYGNAVTRVAFGASSGELFVQRVFEVDTIDARSVGLPVPYDLSPYLANPEDDPSVRAFAAEIAARTNGPRDFLRALTDAVYTMMDRQIRHEGAARSAADTLALRTGACRDLTVLFLAVCRSRGIPARFVSGYQAEAQTPDGQRYLHAWAEALVPGAGWSAWDPTHGLEVTTGHVALCAAPTQIETMPIEGGFTFFGPSRTSTLDFSVRIATS